MSVDALFARAFQRIEKKCPKWSAENQKEVLRQVCRPKERSGFVWNSHVEIAARALVRFAVQCTSPGSCCAVVGEADSFAGGLPRPEAAKVIEQHLGGPVRLPESRYSSFAVWLPRASGHENAVLAELEPITSFVRRRRYLFGMNVVAYSSRAVVRSLLDSLGAGMRSEEHVLSVENVGDGSAVVGVLCSYP